MLEPGRNPMNNAFDNRRVRDDMFPLIWAGMALVMFLDPVWLEHDALAGPDEVTRQTKTVQRLCNESANGRSIFVAPNIFRAEDRNALQRQPGLEHDPCCVLQYCDFATLAAGQPMTFLMADPGSAFSCKLPG